MYRTGDLARYRPDGTLEFLGRIDHQLKLRGFRIELGEIEAVLGRHPAVRESVVLAREDVPGDKRLVAYVVPRIEDGGWKIEDSQESGRESPSSILHPRSSELRAFLKDKLPNYMVPAAFVILDVLPLNANGKIDRHALPAPSCQHSERATAYVAPENDLERSIAAIWREVLRIESVGMHDNFFDLGGNSFHIVQVYSKLRDLAGDIPMVEMFHYPTVAALAAYLGQRSDQPAPLQPTAVEIEKIADGKNRLKKLLKHGQRIAAD
jgi:hypothetical protein